MIRLIKKNLLSFLLLSAMLLFIATACQKEKNPDPIGNGEPDPLASVKSYALALMNDIYYWYKDVPKNIDPKPIKTIQAYFDTLLVPVDRWSWMMTGAQYLSSETGVVETYGISIAQPIDYYKDYSLKVRFVHPNSPMSDNNIKRGYTLTHLNGVPVATLISNGTYNSVYAQKTNTFTFRDLENKTISFTATARQVSTRSFLKTMVITPEDYPGLPHKVGYFHYLSFKATMLDDINNAMALMNTSGVKELILDLRYNGGGDGKATSLLANYLAPVSADKKILAKREHNDKYRSWDNDVQTQTIIQRIGGSLNLNRLFILTTKGSASASEVIINGLKPLMNVVQVGGTTYGKPNGMYVLPFPEGNYDSPQFVFLPICFFSVNSNGYGHYMDGITPDHYRPDDLYHDFGLQEDWVKSVLQFISTGSFPPLPAIPAAAFSATQQHRLALPEDSPEYGVYKVKRNN
ncbi:MAG: S41 family peptidase [Bacteroidales bacterium]|jgi:carboxyl-terminal processing protease|nr:S41 family peptidase [Bacteroidales bacterium]